MYQIYQQILLIQHSAHLLLPLLLLLQHLHPPLPLLLLLPPSPLSLLLLQHQLSQGAGHDVLLHLLHLDQLRQDPNMVKLVRPALWKLWIVHCCYSRVSPLKSKKDFNQFVAEQKLQLHSTILLYEKNC